MNFISKDFDLFGKKINLATIIWFLLAFIAALLEVLRNAINNYHIFEGVFWHTLHKMPLYAEYPKEYFDTNLYGPLFSILIAPFALLPDWAGAILWGLANAWILWFAIKKLDIAPTQQLIILWIGAIELMTSIHNLQFNACVAALLILAYICVEKEMDFWATLFIAIGFLCKIYGIAGLLFFVFSKHKVKFVTTFIFWLVILFLLPMLISSPQFILDSYGDWIHKIMNKNDSNIYQSVTATGGMQDISFMGMIRRIFDKPIMGNIGIMAPAAALILLPLLRFNQYKFKAFQLSYLAIVLISIVIFSSSAESPTYIIAVVGIAIWYVMHYKDAKVLANIVLIATFFFTILSPTDLFPAFLKDHFVRKYALKALPSTIVWFLLIKDVAFKNFIPTKLIRP
ncbi:MAG: DUF2029 domain-containing protein [Bacteroidetes bacterium]|nr:DUF2029 domain-containing protein [Bacteroidota bacterium]